MRLRLDRWLGMLTPASRGEGKEWIRKGLVRVNGEIVRDPGATFETETDALSLRGEPLDGRTVRHVMLHKPAGLLTAARDKKQPTVMDLLPPVMAGIGCMPVGRLDKDTTGLLFLTTDGELNHRLLAPGRHVEKVYTAETEGRLTEDCREAFRSGMDLGDFTARPAELNILRAGDDISLGEVTISEGKFHQVKRMFEAVGHPVIRLHRDRFGPLELGDLPEGAWRELTENEVRALREAAGMTENGG